MSSTLILVTLIFLEQDLIVLEHATVDSFQNMFAFDTLLIHATF